MFPTSSMKNKECVWLSYYQINCNEERNNKTYIMFKDGTYFYFENQFTRTSKVIAVMNGPLYWKEWSGFDNGA